MNPAVLARVLWSLRQQRRRESWPRARILAYQNAALGQLRAHALARSPFYRRLHGNLHDRPLHELPIVTKAMLMEHFDEAVTDRTLHLHDVEAHAMGPHAARRLDKRYWVSATSGSSGRRGLFVFDTREWAAVIASFARGREWAGAHLDLRKRMRLATVASTTPWHMSALVGLSLRSPWVASLRLDAAEPLPTIVARLNAFQPDSLIAYASMAGILADEQLAGRLRITPRQIYPSSEVLTSSTRAKVEAAWGRVIFEQYASTETAGIAAECTAHHGLHLFDDLVITEVVDGDNRPVPAGADGEKLLVTVLWSRTLPLIRYELTDRVRVAASPEPCRLPFPVIAGIQGRTDDALSLPSRAGGMVSVHPHVFHSVLDIVPAAAWQVVRQDDHITVVLAGAADDLADAGLLERLRQALAAQGAAPIALELERVASIPKGATGKTRLIVDVAHESSTPAIAFGFPEQSSGATPQ